MCLATQSCMEDEDVKVVGNAIRSVGHVAVVISKYSAIPVQVEQYFGKSVTVLTTKVRQAGGVATSELSWKQRSAAKKNGWGACHALGLMLDCLPLHQHEPLHPSFKDALEALFTCIHRWETLNEKITLAALKAVQRIRRDRLIAVAYGTTLIGEGILKCVQVLRHVSLRETIVLCFSKLKLF